MKAKAHAGVYSVEFNVTSGLELWSLLISSLGLQAEAKQRHDIQLTPVLKPLHHRPEHYSAHIAYPLCTTHTILPDESAQR